jgi:hypothetical protein
MKIDGRCHCGNITFEAEVDPATVAICHRTGLSDAVGNGVPYCCEDQGTGLQAAVGHAESLRHDRGKAEIGGRTRSVLIAVHLRSRRVGSGVNLMAPLPTLALVLLVGIVLGYGTRALISNRRRAAARRRFIERGFG